MNRLSFLTVLVAVLLYTVFCRTNDATFVGGTGGLACDDNQEQDSRVNTIEIHHDTLVNGIQFFYRTTANVPTTGSLHGTNTGTLSTVSLQNDEFVKEVYVFANDQVNQLTFTTNQGTCGPYGSATGEGLKVVAGEGRSISNFAGRSDTTLNQLGFLVYLEWSGVLPVH